MDSVPPHYTAGPAQGMRGQPRRSRHSGPATTMNYFNASQDLSQNFGQDSFSPNLTYPGSVNRFGSNGTSLSKSPGIQTTPIISDSLSQDQLEVSPINAYDGLFDGFLTSNEPWNSTRLTSHSVPGSLSGGGFRLPLDERAYQYRGPTQDDNESFTTAPPASHADSALHSGTFSASSHEPRGPSQDFNELVTCMRSMRPHDVRSTVSSNLEVPGVQNHPQSPSSDTAVDLACQYCGKTFRLQSEVKKHLSKHEKPHSCWMQDCRRKEGFTSHNDLMRHLRSVHNFFQPGSKVFKCASSLCIEKDKLWPRQDNFVQHIDRMHKDEDQEDLLQRSEQIVTKADEPYIGKLDDSSPLQPLPTGRRSRQGRRATVHYNEPEDTNELYLTTPKKRRKASSPTPSPSQGFLKPPPVNTRGRRPSSTYSKRSLPSAIKAEDRQGIQVANKWNRTSAKDDVSANIVPADVVLHQGSQEEKQKSQLADFLAQQLKMNVSGDSLEDKIRQAIDNAFNSSKFDILKRLEDSSTQRSRASKTRSGWSAPQNGTSSQQFVPRQALETIDHQSSGYDVTATDLECPKCHKVLARHCDMKRHMRRHTRPFGCTFDSCYKQFGSKNDWKRHENSQHCQEDLWRCEELSPKNRATINREDIDISHICTRVFSNKAYFAAHLRKTHDIQSKERLDWQLKRQRIGFNGLGSFWCGFCQKIIGLEHKGLKAWEDRFNHIGDHFSNNESISQWLPPEGKRTKGEIEAMNPQTRQQELEDLKDKDLENVSIESDDDVQPIDPQEPNNEQYVDMATMGDSELPYLDSPIVPTFQGDEVPEESLIRDLYCCCACGEGPMRASVHDRCPNCHHVACASCR